MRQILLFLIIICASSCNNQNEFQQEINQLKSENDSLTSIVKSLENKYVFDKVFMKYYPVKNSKIKKGTKYYGEFVFVPAVEQDLVLFGTEVEKDNGFNIINADTLRTGQGDSGTYKFEVDIINDTTSFFFKPLIKNKLSLEYQNSAFNSIMFSDKRLAQ